MTDAPQNQLAADVARDLVSQMAPQEMPLFRANSEAYFKDPQKVLDSQTGKDDMLGFGTGEVVAYLTPVVLSISVEVIKFLTEEVRKSLQSESSSVINDVVKGMFSKFRPPAAQAEQPAPVSLTVEQLREVRRLAFEKARQLRVSEARATQLADSLIGGLVAPA